ncbi:MAG: trypsin-like peptidase domain-containing protein [Alphaproteobacteria bacterium]|nr:trypsin-like peptidase domain-containing protein [Alphaproteobacteria bacterium]
MSFRKITAVVAVLLTLSLLPDAPARALPPEARDSVVSVLPVWPGRAQGGRGGPPGVAPEGSGVVLKAGVIATAWHVIEPAERIDVRLSDGRILPARLIARDVASDIALLSVEADLSPVRIAPDPVLAQPVCAVGNAYGLGLSVTCGVVSALNVSNAGFNPVEDFVQTDAAVNPGMSGGALYDRQGRLVGMLSAIFASQAESNIGVNFAVSTDLLTRVATALETEGAVAYPAPGWRLRAPDREQAAVLAAPVVAAIGETGPAAAAGIGPGDRVIEIGDRRIRSPRDAIGAFAVIDPSAGPVTVVIERDGTRRQVTLSFGEAEAESETPVSKTQTPETVLGDCPHPAAVCRMRQAVFPVSSFDPIGSATRIGPGLLVTNRHVTGDRMDAVVHTPDGPRGGRVVPSAYDGDLVLLAVEGLPAEGYIPDLDGETTDEGPFHAVGADIGRQEVRVFAPGGLIAGPADGAALGRLHVRAWMQPGVSGGALVDADGDLVGIAVGGGDGRFEAMPLDAVRTLLALRESGTAETLTRELGEALAACETVMEEATTGTVASEGLVDVCAAGRNHGQLLEAGRILARAGDFDAAAAMHAQAVRQVPNSVNARVSLLVSLQLAARFEEMTDHARRVMELAPDDPQILRFAIQSGVWGDDPDLAEEGYRALLKANPQQAQAARRFIDNAPPAPARR